MRIPGLIDAHVHLRDPGEPHKEDFSSGTSAALAGGVVTLIDMPNNREPITNPQSLEEKRKMARSKAVCDYGFYLGATRENVGGYGEKVVKKVWGLKMYLNQTYGPLLLSQPQEIADHLHHWPTEKPLLVHAEGETVAFILNMIKDFPRRVHFCHLSLKEEVEQIRRAKEAGLPITCEVTPHHLFLTDKDEKVLGPFGRMRPPLRTAKDVDALWQNLDVIDIVVSDHAPHTKEEKLSGNPPFGVPGVETTLPLLLTAVSQKKLSLERLIELVAINPARILGIKQDELTHIEVDLQASYVIENSALWTKCGWSPFEGKRVIGKVRRVFLRGQKVYEDGKVLVRPGFGKEINP